MQQPLPPKEITSPSAERPGGWRLEAHYANLPPLLHAACMPEPAPAPSMVAYQPDLALELGLNPKFPDPAEPAGWFSGSKLPPAARPLAQAYAGHQYGHFTGLGDGRALLLGEQRLPDGSLRDIQLKGSGRTPFSRNGDGRAALGPMLREFLISEAMHALGIPTTRSLAVTTTGETILRHDGPQPGAVLTRVAASHIRVGTFEWAAAHENPEAVNALIHFTLNRHFPTTSQTHPNLPPAAALLDAVVESQAKLIAQWMLVGFVHGVMNTDNMALSGETIDYGPCAFLDHYDPSTVFSSIDRGGRYAYGRQPRIAQWNLARFAETLLTHLHPETSQALEIAQNAVESFQNRYHHHWLTGMRAKLGLASREPTDADLANDLLTAMHQANADFTLTFSTLSRPDAVEIPPYTHPALLTWHARWQDRLVRENSLPSSRTQLMSRHNPTIIPRNRLVEQALQAATHAHDLQPFHRLWSLLRHPFAAESDIPEAYRIAPAPDGPRHVTYCGT
jgi:serine/tyrosine/threonine adenylyltransferase